MKKLVIFVVICTVSILLLHAMEKERNIFDIYHERYADPYYDPEYQQQYRHYQDLIKNREKYISEFINQGMSPQDANEKYKQLLGNKSEELTHYRTWWSATK